MNKIREHILTVLIFLVVVIFFIKLLFIQVLSQEYATRADMNIIHRIVEYPIRGLIYDRNGKLMVYNKPEYDLLVVQREIQNFDTLKFCEVFNMSTPEVKKLFDDMKARREYSSLKPTLFLNKMTSEDLAKVVDRMDEFSGFYIQPRTARAYTSSSAANVLGYVSEITRSQLSADTAGYYNQGDYVGQSGIEAFYEKELRGLPGVRYEMRDVKGISQGSFNGGDYDTLSVPGKDLYVGIDLELQQYAEKLMAGKVGSIVSIEPSTGEILAFVSAPSYDPNLLTGKNYSENYSKLSQDSLKPFFNRPMMAQYRPGSIFKIAQALSALQDGVIKEDTWLPCNQNLINCHGVHRGNDLRNAIAKSCNPYFYEVMRRMTVKGKSESPYEDIRIGLPRWNEYIYSLGLGKPLGVDLFNEKSGLVPTVAYYDRAYNNEPWKFSNIYSIAIGEGENLVVPLQMANFTATIANRGYFYTPHVVKAIGVDGRPEQRFTERHFTAVDTAYFRVAVDAMEAVVDHGTGQYRAKLNDIVVCGKTGTVQNIPPRKDHSAFIAFAPKDNPVIALSVYVEDAGEGGRAAAAIAGLLIEQYIQGTTKRPYMETYVLNGVFE